MPPTASDQSPIVPRNPNAYNNGVVNTVIDIPPMVDAEDYSKLSKKIVERARKVFNEGRTRTLKFRKSQLKSLLRFLRENEDAILKALQQDLRKSKQEAVCFEINFVANEVRSCLRSLETWAKPERVKKPLANLLDGVMVYSEPYGVVLVMGAWNYPLQLVLAPLVGAIAAGNCAIIKPSDLSPATSRLLHDLLPSYLDQECYPVYLGGIPETTELLKQRFDYIFYTGSTEVGRIVHRAANRFLTPTTLELGGKCPAFIDASADLERTVRRILWGKCINAGQTCVAPDYVLCTKQVQDKFINCSVKVLKEFYGDNIRDSPDYCRIITERHFTRLVSLLDGLKIAIGGKYDASDLYIEPTIAIDVSPNHPIMHEEIFGPILPIVLIRDVDEAIAFINRREKPLALYVFSNKTTDGDMILQRTSSGGVTINDTVLHVACETLPFGGVGNSGMGAYHGKNTFDSFVHKRSVLVKNFRLIPEKLMAVRYPPYSDSKIRVMSLGMKSRGGVSVQLFLYLFAFCLGILVTIGAYFLYKFLGNN